MFQKYFSLILLFRKETYFLLYWISLHADTHDFQEDFPHQFAVGMPDGDWNNFGARFVFVYTKILKQNLLCLSDRFKKLFELFHF